MADFDLDKLTIACFSKGRHSLQNVDKSDQADPDSLKFYKKRIVSVTKDLAKGKEAAEELKTAYSAYAMRLVSYFKAQDKSLIIQETYKGMKVAKKAHDSPDESTDMNSCMMRKPIDNNMCGYVVRHNTRTEISAPEIKLIDLKRTEFKKKKR